jgi:hypothetical protein
VAEHLHRHPRRHTHGEHHGGGGVPGIVRATPRDAGLAQQALPVGAVAVRVDRLGFLGAETIDASGTGDVFAAVAERFGAGPDAPLRPRATV